MATLVPHNRYLAVIAQEVVLTAPCNPPEGEWWRTPVHKIGGGIGIYAVPSAGRSRPQAILTGTEDHQAALDFCEWLRTDMDRFVLEGGLAFIDLDSATLLRTNWDLGETEEWNTILDRLDSGSRVTHTFSATDSALDLWKEGHSLRLQLLDWEALPDGIATSRLSEPIHVFAEVDGLVTQVRGILRWLDGLIRFAGGRTGVSPDLLHVLSVSARRNRPPGQPTPSGFDLP